MKTEFSHFVPKEIIANLKWRSKVHERVLQDPEFADAMRDACAKDPIFFMNGFAWTYDPRRTPFPRLPFILYDFQEEVLLEIIDVIGKKDLLIEKSRDMGASWLCISAFFWKWRFVAMQSFLLVSRVEAYVDDSENPKSLMWKWDFLLDNLPLWLQPQGYNPNLHRRKMHISNPENGSVCDGESTNINVARGDRRTAIMLDEFAVVEQGTSVLKATRDATNCRIFNSTPFGIGNAFYDIRQTKIKKLRLHWSIHPLKSIGLYTSTENGKLRILDPEGYPEDYHPILDSKERSPWYDVECSRASIPQEIAQELDIDYLGSGHQFFNSDLVQAAIRSCARPPIMIGDLEYDDTTAEPIRFREDPEGKLKLWFLLNKNEKPPLDHKIIIGVDVAAGTGASNSTIVGWDAITNEKVFEYANPYIRPEALAKQAVAIARWCSKKEYDGFIISPYLIWESNGPGRQFGSRVIELGYSNIYLRKREEAISKKVSDVPGWAPTREGKLVLLGNYRDAVEKGKCVNRSKEALEETLEYIFAPNGSVQHSQATNRVDPSGAGASHGDRVIADALAWHGMSERRVKPEKEEPEVPIGCLQWRMNMRKKEEQPAHRELDNRW